MAPKIWKEIQLSNNSVQIISLERERVEEAVAVMNSAFYPFENISKGCDVTSNSAACDELGKLTAAIAEDGVSVIAVVKETNEVIGASFNKLQKLGTPGELSFFEKFRDEHCKEEHSISLINFMIDLDSCVNLFEILKTDCLIELTFLGVQPEWGHNGIGQELVNCSLDLVKSLQKDKKTQSAAKHVSVLATSIFSYKILKNANFQDIYKKEFSDYDFNGKWKYSEKVDCNLHNQGVVLMAREV